MGCFDTRSRLGCVPQIFGLGNAVRARSTGRSCRELDSTDVTGREKVGAVELTAHGDRYGLLLVRQSAAERRYAIRPPTGATGARPPRPSPPGTHAR